MPGDAASRRKVNGRQHCQNEKIPVASCEKRRKAYDDDDDDDDDDAADDDDAKRKTVQWGQAIFVLLRRCSCLAAMLPFLQSKADTSCGYGGGGLLNREVPPDRFGSCGICWRSGIKTLMVQRTAGTTC